MPSVIGQTIGNAIAGGATQDSQTIARPTQVPDDPVVTEQIDTNPYGNVDLQTELPSLPAQSLNGPADASTIVGGVDGPQPYSVFADPEGLHILENYKLAQAGVSTPAYGEGTNPDHLAEGDAADPVGTNSQGGKYSRSYLSKEYNLGPASQVDVYTTHQGNYMVISYPDQSSAIVQQQLVDDNGVGHTVSWLPNPNDQTGEVDAGFRAEDGRQGFITGRETLAKLAQYYQDLATTTVSEVVVTGSRSNIVIPTALTQSQPIVLDQLPELPELPELTPAGGGGDTGVPSTPVPSLAGHGLRPGVAQILGRISMGEGTSDVVAQRHGFASGYDVPLAFGRFGMPPKPISQMTLGEVKAYQRAILSNPNNHMNSSAVGRYQIVGRTLRGLQRAMGLGDDVVFTPQLQDRMAQEILLENGLRSYQSGRITSAQFQERIANQWASVAHPNTGRGTQGLGTTTDQIQAV